MEMREVLRRVLQRTTLAPADPELEQIQFRAITLAPRNGVRVTQTREAQAAEDAEEEGGERGGRGGGG